MRRSRTNTPLQALVTLNDTQFVEAARFLAQRAILEGGKTRVEQIEFAFRQATGTRPRQDVLDLLKRTFDEELKVFEADPERAKSLLTIGEAKRDDSIDASQHAAMLIVASVILNLDETLTKG